MVRAEEYVNDNYYARFTLAAINDAEKTKLRCNFEVKIWKVSGSQNIGQGHWVKVCA